LAHREFFEIQINQPCQTLWHKMICVFVREMDLLTNTMKKKMMQPSSVNYFKQESWSSSNISTTSCKRLLFQTGIESLRLSESGMCRSHTPHGTAEHKTVQFHTSSNLMVWKGEMTVLCLANSL
jgi:hypothetical protein